MKDVAFPFQGYRAAVHGNRTSGGTFASPGKHKEATMPIFILWAGIPILILGGGFVIYRVIGG